MQIQITINKSKEAKYLASQKLKTSLRLAQAQGKKIGSSQGDKKTIKKKGPAKEYIKKHSIAFGGDMKDAECMLNAKVSRNTYYKYKRELLEELLKEQQN